MSVGVDELIFVFCLFVVGVVCWVGSNPDSQNYCNRAHGCDFVHPHISEPEMFKMSSLKLVCVKLQEAGRNERFVSSS